MNTSLSALQAFGDITNFHLSQNPVPQKGSRVLILKGKHKDQEGSVMWVGDTYASRTAFKPKTLGSAMLDAMGYNLRIGIQLDNGSRVFIDFYKNVQTLK